MNEKEEGRKLVLDEVTGHILEIDLQKMDISNDDMVASNAAKLDRMVRLVSLYKRMLDDNPDYPEDFMSKKKAKLVREQVDRVSDALAYYQVRRMILSNSFYQTHLGDELSMNAEDSDPKEKKQLAKLLRAAYYLGKNMGISDEEDGEITTQPLTLSPKSSLAKKDEKQIHRISKDPRDYADDEEWLSALKRKGKNQRKAMRGTAQEALIEELERDNTL